jgi:enoyl-CoA hydratase/carnithine racemase
MAARLDVRDEGGVRTLTLENPAKKNALDEGLLDALAEALVPRDDVRALLVRGAGEGIFSAGYDLAALASLTETTPLPDEKLGRVLDLLTSHPAPSVALVTGPAFGAGCELALACDFRVGDAGALFCLPPAKLGVVYALKGLARVASRVGLQQARYLFLTGRRVAGPEALQRGLLDLQVTDAEREAVALALELSRNAPQAVRHMKTGLALVGARPAISPEAEAAYEVARRRSFLSDDAREGREATLAKRPRHFTGR